MPFSATRDAETYWRTRYGLPAGANNGSQGAEPRKPAASRKKFRFRKPVFSSSRTQRGRRWTLLALVAVSVAAYALLVPGYDRTPDSATPKVQKAALTESPEALVPVRAADFNALLADFNAEREASLVALRGYLLTDGEGFHREWLQASVRLQDKADALVHQSSTWTDGRKLVQLVEMQRLVERLLAEQRAVASIVGTVNRYPGLQLYTEDVQPALAEAQRLCSEVMNAMLAISSPDVVGPVGPFAEFRGDLEDLRGGVADYMGASRETAPPEVAGDARFEAMRETLSGVRPQVPADMQQKIDRLTSLIGTAQEKLARIFALRETARWDYADYAFKTRVEPLAGKLQAIGMEWTASAGQRS